MTTFKEVWFCCEETLANKIMVKLNELMEDKSLNILPPEIEVDDEKIYYMKWNDKHWSSSERDVEYILNVIKDHRRDLDKPSPNEMLDTVTSYGYFAVMLDYDGYTYFDSNNRGEKIMKNLNIKKTTVITNTKQTTKIV